MNRFALPLVLCVLLAPRLAARGGDDETDTPRGAAAPAQTAAQTSAGIRPTLAEIFKPPTLLGQPPRVNAISADGRYALVRLAREDVEEPKFDLYLAPTDGGEMQKLCASEDDARAVFLATGCRLLVTRHGWLELHDPDAGTNTPLLEVGDTPAAVTLFDDGVRAALLGARVKDGARLYVLDLESGVRTTPADRLEDVAPWHQRLEDADAIALLARPPKEREGDATGAAAKRGTTPVEDAAPPARESRESDPPTTGARPDGEREADGESKRVLWIVPLEPGAEPYATTFGGDGRIAVSPDARFAVRTERRFDVRRRLIMADYLTEHVSSVGVRGDLAGDPGASGSVRLFDVDQGEEFDPPLDQGTNFHLLDVEFAPHGHALLVHRISNDFHVRQILLVDPETRSTRLLFSERDDAWIGGPLTFAGFSGDAGNVLFTSEQSGFNRLYAVPVTGGQPHCISGEDGRFEIDEVLVGRDDAVVVRDNEGDPADRVYAIVSIAEGGRKRLTAADGVSSAARWSAGGGMLVHLRETLGAPAEVWAQPIDGTNAAPRRLTRTVPAALESLALPAPEIVEYQNPADGKTVRALLYRPEPFDPTAVYPAVMFIHGAGYLQNVQRSMTGYPVNMLFHHRLARLGFVVLDPDYRHSEGYGRDFRTDVFGHMGGKDLDDVVAGVDWLKSLGFVDTARVGIYGGSYGGFMTLMALFTKPDVFACGAALRSVTDWRTYNSAYTTARLGDPAKDAQNYARSSPIDHAEGLKKPLLILHGLKDRNVFAQDSIRLIEKLIQSGKDFDAMLYPSQDHGFTDPEAWIDEYRRIERLFVRELRPGA